MNEFEYKSYLDKRKMALSELKTYYYNLNLYEKDNSITSKRIKRRMMYLIRFITKLNRLLSHRSLKILGNQSYPTTDPVLYICTKSDYAVESLTELVTGPFGVSIEDKESLSDIERLLLETGVLRLFTEEDKGLAQNRQISNLLNNGTEIIFPEISSSTSTLVGELSDDASELVIKTGATIIPVATESYRNGEKIKSVINIGKNLQIGSSNPEYIKDITKIIGIDLEHLKEEIHSKRYTKNIKGNNIFMV